MIKALITRHVFQVFLLFWWAKVYKNLQHYKIFESELQTQHTFNLNPER